MVLERPTEQEFTQQYQEEGFLEKMLNQLLKLRKLEAKQCGRIVVDVIKNGEECHIGDMGENEIVRVVKHKKNFDKIMELI